MGPPLAAAADGGSGATRGRFGPRMNVDEGRSIMPADHQVLVEAEAVCVQAVRQAGAVLLEYFRQPLTVEFKEKGQQSPVTEADRRSEELLRVALTQAFPEHGIIGEEAEDAINPSADYVWFLDPLDGTTNFTAGLPAFAISMGCAIAVYRCWASSLSPGRVQRGPSFGPTRAAEPTVTTWRYRWPGPRYRRARGSPACPSGPCGSTACTGGRVSC